MKVKLLTGSLILVTFLLFSPPSSNAEGGPVVVANIPLGIHHIIKEGDVRIVMMGTRDLRDAVDLGEVVGKRVKRPIGVNIPVKRDYLEDARAVKRGDMVILMAEKGNLKISTKGVVKEDGNLGGVVRVENISSGRIVSGRVIGPGMVAVDF